VTFFLDHDVPDEIAHWLRHRDHTVLCLRDALPTTATDAEALASAQAHTAILVSCNRNAFIALGPEGAHPGIIILIRRRTRQAEIAALRKLLASAGEQGLANNINFA
jgi:predicted nuclease of predicted toxin-antitoxin system